MVPRVGNVQRGILREVSCPLRCCLSFTPGSHPCPIGNRSHWYLVCVSCVFYFCTNEQMHTRSYFPFSLKQNEAYDTCCVSLCFFFTQCCILEIPPHQSTDIFPLKNYFLKLHSTPLWVDCGLFNHCNIVQLRPVL